MSRKKQIRHQRQRKHYTNLVLTVERMGHSMKQWKNLQKFWAIEMLHSETKNNGFKYDL